MSIQTDFTGGEIQHGWKTITVPEIMGILNQKERKMNVMKNDLWGFMEQTQDKMRELESSIVSIEKKLDVLVEQHKIGDSNPHKI